MRHDISIRGFLALFPCIVEPVACAGCWERVPLPGYFPSVSHVTFPRSLCCNPPFALCLTGELSAETCCALPEEQYACTAGCGILNYHRNLGEGPLQNLTGLGKAQGSCLLQKIIDLVHDLVCGAWTEFFTVTPSWTCRTVDGRFAHNHGSLRDALRACDLPADVFFDLVGTTREQLLYLLWLERPSSEVPAIFFSPQGGLIFDLGASDGTDTAFYLASGFRVVAVEASEQLYAQTRHRFQRWLGDQLELRNVAITADSGETIFYVDESKRGSIVWNSSTAATLRVPSVTCADLVFTHGSPLYIKIDIEGADIHCLASLMDAQVTPPYLSLEALPVKTDSNLPVMLMLSKMGYTRFKLVRQAIYTKERRGLGSSGPWGEHAVDWHMGARWRPAQAILEDLALLYALRSDAAVQFPAPPTGFDWFDIHAAS